ncbi:Endonuclease related to archaeal Holliday junction resolvase [Candidatus Tiddalikarchaeum anstoanum]|nr:Endonuclease related to archaeal Holliday junction resolvase [Candidatus Tiddalikarchaeum anstoanum]
MIEFLEDFREFRKILCVCPCCGEMTRVSDLKLYTKKPLVKTWLDEFEEEDQKLTKKVENFDEKEGEIRQHSIELGRTASKKILNQFMKRHMTPAFFKLKINPFDVKPILNPVDFLVFNGMSDEEGIIEKVMFLSKESMNEQLNCLRNQIKLAVENKKYDWKITRISQNGNIEYE